MNFLNKLEKKYGRYAIHNLMNYIVIMYAAGVFLQLVNPFFYYQYLSLDAAMILKGQVWRIVTFMIWPPFTNMLSNLIMIYLYYSLGKTLENVWGAFRFNIYMFMGILGHVFAALVGLLLFGQRWLLTPTYLNLSIFLAFAATFPDLQFYLYFVIPIKAKVMGIIYAVITGWSAITGTASDRCAIIMSLANFLIYFALTRNYRRIRPSEIKKQNEFRQQVKMKPAGATRHKCAVCGRTELDGDELEFRYCSKCEGEYEYCQDHLYTHQHVTKAKVIDQVNHSL